MIPREEKLAMGRNILTWLETAGSEGMTLEMLTKHVGNVATQASVFLLVLVDLEKEELIRSLDYEDKRRYFVTDKYLESRT